MCAAHTRVVANVGRTREAQHVSDTEFICPNLDKTGATDLREPFLTRTVLIKRVHRVRVEHTLVMTPEEPTGHIATMAGGAFRCRGRKNFPATTSAHVGCAENEERVVVRRHDLGRDANGVDAADAPPTVPNLLVQHLAGTTLVREHHLTGDDVLDGDAATVRETDLRAGQEAAHRHRAEFAGLDVRHQVTVLAVCGNQDVNVEGLAHVAGNRVDDATLRQVLNLNVFKEVVCPNERTVRLHQHGARPRIAVVVDVLRAVRGDDVGTPPTVYRLTTLLDFAETDVGGRIRVH